MRASVVAALAVGVASVLYAGQGGATAGTGREAPGTPPASVRFAVKGDWGYGGADQASVTRRMCAVHRASPFAFVVTTGDNFYRPDGTATDTNFTVPERCLLRARLPWFAAWGNHDLGGDGTATALGATRHWYTVVRGPLRLIVLDANTPTDADQLAFLRTTLRRATEPARIVAFHQPAYTMGLHEPGIDQQRLWAPLFRRYGVTLVLQGHNHAYERMVVRGVTYITTGGGGAPLYPCVRSAPGAAKCEPVFHFLAVTASRTEIRVRVIRAVGGVVEDITLPVRAPR